jgi:hypothetical protein
MSGVRCTPCHAERPRCHTSTLRPFDRLSMRSGCAQFDSEGSRSGQGQISRPLIFNGIIYGTKRNAEGAYRENRITYG